MVRSSSTPSPVGEVPRAARPHGSNRSGPRRFQGLHPPHDSRPLKDLDMSSPAWQKSSYCAQGDSCVHVAAPAPGTVSVTESGDPTGAVLRITPGAWADLVRALKEGRCQD
ncbi:DUF397 domain-containing protein [Streptomyces sp. NPDC014685]|uniref:DUF397 domain-containing protein n=1 Tax=Streptomyces sp. NPDC014685 TaxID=3364881 RepID=UPI003700DDE5